MSVATGPMAEEKTSGFFLWAWVLSRSSLRASGADRQLKVVPDRFSGARAPDPSGSGVEATFDDSLRRKTSFL